MLGRTRADGSPLVRVERLMDGVVAFEEEGDAARFADALEADGHGAVRCVAFVSR